MKTYSLLWFPDFGQGTNVEVACTRATNVEQAAGNFRYHYPFLDATGYCRAETGSWIMGEVFGS